MQPKSAKLMLTQETQAKPTKHRKPTITTPTNHQNQPMPKAKLRPQTKITAKSNQIKCTSKSSLNQSKPKTQIYNNNIITQSNHKTNNQKQINLNNPLANNQINQSKLHAAHQSKGIKIRKIHNIHNTDKLASTQPKPMLANKINRNHKVPASRVNTNPKLKCPTNTQVELTTIQTNQNQSIETTPNNKIRKSN